MIPPLRLHHHTWIVAFSGGKDSTATLLWALDQNPPSLYAVFNDTGAEWPETYQYLDQIENLLNLKIIRLKPDSDLAGISLQFGRWPAHKVRFCTQHLKSEILNQWLLENKFKDLVILFGQRRQESRNRAKLAPYEPPPLGPAGGAILRPVLEWDEEQVFAYLESKHIPPIPSIVIPE